jgi:mannose/cellobiose epimerase-like protein (N-acyl-D-glucosamine 2-epimerase family)
MPSSIAPAQPRQLPTADVTEDLWRWMGDVALPFWATRGLDPETGLFWERMTAEGTPDRAAPRRIRVQARQIYSFAHAAVLGLHPQGTALALGVFDRLLAAAEAPDGAPGFVQALAPDGTVQDPTRDAYDHAFLVLAFAWLSKASGAPRVAAALERCLDFVDQGLGAADGSLYESVPRRLPRRQNPQMHWFESVLALMELGHPGAAARAATARRLFDDKLYHRPTRTIGEYFAEDWHPLPDAAARIVEPGHLAEWSWLLRRYDALAGLPPCAEAADLLRAALRWTQPATGLLVDEVDRDGPVLRGTSRIWLQTELVKARLAMAEAGGGAEREAAIAALAAMRDHFLGKPWPAGWIDQLDAVGRPVPGPVPASILYHVFVAVAEAKRILGTSRG